MIYKDRIDAGKKLAQPLGKYIDDPTAILIALPRGGVVIGCEIASLLHLPLDIVCPRKIGAPFNEEFAIGAITETGECIISQELVEALSISKEYLQHTAEQEARKARWRLESYRRGKAPRNVANKRVILVDDGLATGATMHAAIKTVRSEQAKEIIIAVPVAAPSALSKLKKEVDIIICLQAPESFFAVSQFYENFDQITDEEVVTILEKML